MFHKIYDKIKYCLYVRDKNEVCIIQWVIFNCYHTNGFILENIIVYIYQDITININCE